MKEKRVLLALFILFFAAVLSVFSNVNLVSAAVNETEKMNLAYNWLSGKVATWPSIDEGGAFALMALAYDDALAQKGKAALIAVSRDNGTCWPSSSCNVKSTALAILALNILDEDTAKAENWLLSRERSYTDPSAEWHLQIDSDGATRCTIEYDDRAYPANLTESKEFIQPSAGSCLSTKNSIYGYKIATSCLDKTFLIKCDDDFYVSMIYIKGNIIYVPGTTQAGSSGTYVETKIETVCLADGSTCTYEGTAWGAYALFARGRDYSMLIPYLIGFAADNPLKMPEAFLYLATSDSAYADKLLALQHPNGYWPVSGDRIYDTAIAIMALKDYNPDAKEKAKEYILNAQLGDVPWNNIKDTSLVLYVFGSKTVAPPIPPGLNGCERRGFACRDSCYFDEEEESDYSDECGEQLCCAPKVEKTCVTEGYSCCEKCASGHQTSYDDSCVYLLCCSICETERSCADLGGTFCAEGEECSITLQRTPGGDCCTGECRIPSRTCAEMKGVLCEKGSCTGTTQPATDGLSCCVGGECKKASYLWLIILLLAIIGAVLFYLNKKGIIKLGALFKKKPKPPVSPFGIPISTRPQPQPQQPAKPSARPAIRPLQQWPVVARPPQQAQKPATKTEKELEETFKKIKEI